LFPHHSYVSVVSPWFKDIHPVIGVTDILLEQRPSVFLYAKEHRSPVRVVFENKSTHVLHLTAGLIRGLLFRLIATTRVMTVVAHINIHGHAQILLLRGYYERM
jgi:hypothetical protein